MRSKKGLEMSKLIIFILAIIFLLFIIVYYASLNSSAGNLLDKIFNF